MSDHNQAVLDAANQFIKNIVEQHNENVGKATEAFAKTNALLRGTNDFTLRNGMPDEVRANLHNALLNYGQYMLTQYLNALQLSQEQVTVAAEASEKMLEEIIKLNESAVILTADDK